MTQKSLNLAKELGEYWKVLNDKYVFNDRQFYLLQFSKKPEAPNSIKCMKFLFGGYPSSQVGTATLGYEEPQGNQNKIFLKNWVLDAIYVWN